MDMLIAFVVFVVGGLPLSAIILGAIAWSRTAALRSQLALVTGDIEAWRLATFTLERRIADLEQRREPTPAPEAAPVAAPATAAAPDETADEERRRELLRKVQEAQQPSETPAEAPVETPPSPEPVAAPPPPADPAPQAQTPRGESRGAVLEQWLGVRGAAALGAGVLVLAGLYFFRYSVEHGLIGPMMRVILGTLAGVAAIASAETVLRKRHEMLANFVAGAGIAILYLCFWAATARYALLGTALAGALMLGVTACCGVLAAKRASAAIASLGLLGGFATPILLSTGSDRPVALFSYLLVLDVALLYLAHHRRWSWLALASLVGTAAYQALWIVGRMGDDRVGWGMLLALLFGSVFAIASFKRAQAPEPAEGASPVSMQLITRVAAIMLPFLFGLYFGLRADLGASFWRMGAYLLVLVVGAGAMAHRDRAPWLGLAAVCGALGVLAAWLTAHEVGGAVSWQVIGFVVAVALIQHFWVELGVRRQTLHSLPPVGPGSFPPVGHETVAAAGLWLLGATGLTAWSAATSVTAELWPWLVAWLVLSLIALRQGAICQRPALWLATAIAGGLALCALGAGQLGAVGFPGASATIASFIGFAIAFQLASIVAAAQSEDEGGGRWAGHASAVLPLCILLVLPSAALPIGLHVAATLMLALLACFAVYRSGAAEWLVASSVLVAIAQWWAWQPSAVASAPLSGEAAHILGVGYIGHALAAALFTAFPLMLAREARARTWTWRAAALAAPIFFAPMLALHQRLHGDGVVALLPLGLGALTLAAMVAATRRIDRDHESVRVSALAWLGGATIAFVTVAIPLQLENEWITIGWALQALGMIALWRRVDHAGLKYVALALFACVAVRLLLNAELLQYHERGSWRVLNWLTYTYLVPVGAMVAAIAMMIGPERERLRKWEPRFGDQPISASFLGIAAIATVFAWINLTILDCFSADRMLSLSFERLPARDLTMSIAWAVYGVGLLFLATWRKSAGLRRASLTLMLITCCKVFLYDLAHLDDLYRVVSLVGLALSLIMVSLVYKRLASDKVAT